MILPFAENIIFIAIKKLIKCKYLWHMEIVYEKYDRYFG